MADKHVNAICKGCNKEFSYDKSGLGANRKYCSDSCRPKNYVSKGVWGKRVEWHCQQCGKLEMRTPSEAGRFQFCSRACRGASQRAAPSYECQTCGTTFFRKKRGGDTMEYCSRECSAIGIGKKRRKYDAHVRVWQKYQAIHRRNVKQQISSLIKMSKCVQKAHVICRCCGGTYLRKTKWSHFCSEQCRQISREQAKEKAKRSDSRRRGKRIYKAKRRAMIRAVAAESIDPIKVFERDGWACHICGKKTLKSKRGTSHERAPELEHIVALADGGTHSWSNVACSCRSCNIAKGAQSTGQLWLPMAV